MIMIRKNEYFEILVFTKKEEVEVYDPNYRLVSFQDIEKKIKFFKDRFEWLKGFIQKCNPIIANGIKLEFFYKNDEYIFGIITFTDVEFYYTLAEMYLYDTFRRYRSVYSFFNEHVKPQDAKAPEILKLIDANVVFEEHYPKIDTYWIV